MAIEHSVFEIDGKMYEGYLRVLKTWGSKTEGISALVGIALDKTNALKDEWIHQFEYHTTWKRGNPYEVIYEQIKKEYLRNPLSKAIGDIVSIFSKE